MGCAPGPSARASSFPRQERLGRGCAGDRGVTRRERAAREGQSRVEEALRRLPEIKAAKERQAKTLAKDKRAKVTQPRASTTDPEARALEMPAGGVPPA